MSAIKLTALAAALCATVATVPAHAYVSATAVFEMSNLLFSNSGTGTTLDASDFSFLTWTTTAGMSGNLNAATFGPFSSSAANTNFAPACVGSGCGALGLVNDSWAHAGDPPVGDYAAADQLESGAPITGITGLVAPATIGQSAYAALASGSGLASADTNNNLNSSFVFKLGSSMAVDIDFDMDAYMMVSVTGSEAFPGFATANTEQVFTITDLSTGTDIFTWSVDIFGGGTKTISLNAPLPGSFTLTRNEVAGHFNNTTPILTAGTLYQLSARSNVNADVGRAVPEPAVLGLLGIGLLGLGLARRRSA
ncbi:MAG TPA: EDSAP-1 family PEP-CTERM protein [Thiobacillaceae bacterium]|nr:EDSAP-1 family PEP-CTERM protein [Thiobacillaceae bacterium]HNU63819.1 EDSAP-1 family PEP-CTERM protein [Thiobacillaceae bacterium]